MSSVSSLADASSVDDIGGCRAASASRSSMHDEPSFVHMRHPAGPDIEGSGGPAGAGGARLASIQQELAQKTSEAKRWQDSVLHLSGIATGKDEALAWERARKAQLADELEQALEAAAARQLQVDQANWQQCQAQQQVTALQSEIQDVLGTCSSLERQLVQAEHRLKQERTAHLQTKAHLEQVNAEASRVHERAVRREVEGKQMVQEMQEMVQSALTDRQDALKYVENLRSSTLAITAEAQREVDRSCYLQVEVQRLTRLCDEHRQQQAGQQEEIVSQRLCIETLEARLQEKDETSRDGASTVVDVLELERREKALLRQQMEKCLADFSALCARQHLLVSWIEQARILFVQLQEDCNCVRLELDGLVPAFTRMLHETGARVHLPHASVDESTSLHVEKLREQLHEKQLELESVLQCQAELKAQVAVNEKTIEGHEVALLDAEQALEQAEEAGANSARVIAHLNRELDERSAQLKIAEENIWKGCETAEDLRRQLAQAQDSDQKQNSTSSTRISEKQRELEAANKWLEKERQRLCDLLLVSKEKCDLPAPKEAGHVDIQHRDVSTIETTPAIEQGRKETAEAQGQEHDQDRDQMSATIKGLTNELAECQTALQAANDQVTLFEAALSAERRKVEESGNKAKEAWTRVDEAEKMLESCKSLQERCGKGECDSSRTHAALKAEVQSENTLRMAAEDACSRLEQEVKVLEDKYQVLEVQLQETIERAASEMKEAETRLQAAQQRPECAESRDEDDDRGPSSHAPCASPGPSCGHFDMETPHPRGAPPPRAPPSNPPSPLSLALGGSPSHQPDTPKSIDADSEDGHCGCKFETEVAVLRQQLEETRSQLEECEMQLVEAAERSRDPGQEEKAGACEGKCSEAEKLREQVEDLQVRLVDAVEDQLQSKRIENVSAEATCSGSCAAAEDLKAKLAQVEEALYISEEEHQRVSEKAEELQAQLQELQGQKSHLHHWEQAKEQSLPPARGSPRSEISTDDEIEDDIASVPDCDGSCDAAEKLRAQLNVANRELAAERDESQRQKKMRERLEREVGKLSLSPPKSPPPECNGDCQAAQDLKRQVDVAAARNDDAELENEVLQRKLDLCQSELAAVRVKFQVPEDFFCAEA